MSPVDTILTALAVNILLLGVAAAIGRRLLFKALRALEARLIERQRVVEARLLEQLQLLDKQAQQQAKRAGRDAEGARRAEENLLEVAKGLTAASIRFDERLKALEQKAP